MSYLAQLSMPLGTAARGFALRPTAGLHTSSVRLALNEGNPHDDAEAAEIDRQKSDSLEKAKSGKGEWKPELASQSEQATRGDKSNMTMEQMQNMAKEKGEKDQKGKT